MQYIIQGVTQKLVCVSVKKICFEDVLIKILMFHSLFTYDASSEDRQKIREDRVKEKKNRLSLKRANLRTVNL